MKPFVKSSDTSVPVSRSQGELERVLRRYGATGFGVQSDYEKGIIRVSFRIPDSPGDLTTSVPVRLEVDVKAVDGLLNAGRKRRSTPRTYWRNGQRRTTQAKTGMEQAERVAWRHLVVWVDASLSAAAAGLQRASEAFLAHTLVRNQKGQVLRVVDMMDLEAPGHNWRALLPSST